MEDPNESDTSTLVSHTTDESTLVSPSIKEFIAPPQKRSHKIWSSLKSLQGLHKEKSQTFADTDILRLTDKKITDILEDAIPREIKQTAKKRGFTKIEDVFLLFYSFALISKQSPDTCLENFKTNLIRDIVNGYQHLSDIVAVDRASQESASNGKKHIIVYPDDKNPNSEIVRDYLMAQKNAPHGRLTAYGIKQHHDKYKITPCDYQKRTVGKSFLLQPPPSVRKSIEQLQKLPTTISEQQKTQIAKAAEPIAVDYILSRLNGNKDAATDSHAKIKNLYLRENLLAHTTEERDSIKPPKNRSHSQSGR